MQAEIKEVVIVGAGPAGVSAAVQLKRWGLDPCLIDKKTKAGGLIENAYSVQNYPGLEQPLNGIILSERMNDFLKSNKIKILNGQVQLVEKKDDLYLVHLEGSVLFCKNLVFAVGTRPKTPSENDLKLIKRDRVFYEVAPILRDYNLHNKKVLIVGGGEASLDYALSLSDVMKEIVIIIRGSFCRSNQILKKEVESRKNIKILYKKTLQDVINEQNFDSVFFAIGRESILSEIKLNFDISVEKNVFVVGDAKTGSLGQIGIAVGDGLNVARRICENCIQHTRE